MSHFKVLKTAQERRMIYPRPDTAVSRQERGQGLEARTLVAGQSRTPCSPPSLPGATFEATPLCPISVLRFPFPGCAISLALPSPATSCPHLPPTRAPHPHHSLRSHLATWLRVWILEKQHWHGSVFVRFPTSVYWCLSSRVLSALLAWKPEPLILPPGTITHFLWALTSVHNGH